MKSFLPLTSGFHDFTDSKLGLIQSESGLNRKRTKEDDEAWHAAVFGCAYAFVKNIRPLWVLVRECEDYDAVFNWRNNGTIQRVPVQLKEVPSLNPDETIDLLLQKAKKYSGNDLFLVLHMNRSERFTTIAVPPLQVRQLWLWGGRRRTTRKSIYEALTGRRPKNSAFRSGRLHELACECGAELMH